MELLAAIALLCQVSSYNVYYTIEQRQLMCQKWYVNCVQTKYDVNNGPIHKSRDTVYLKQCILEKK